MSETYKVTNMRDGFLDYVRVEGVDYSGNYELKIMLSNEIKGLLKVKNTQDEIRYIINGYVDFKTAFKRSANVSGLISFVYKRMIEVLKNIEDYTLKPEGILISPGTVFVNEDTSEVAFIYVPGANFKVKEDFISFTEYIMKNMNHMDDEAVLIGYGIYSIIRQEHYEINDVARFIDEHSKKKQVRLKTEIVSDDKSNKETDDAIKVEVNKTRNVTRKKMLNLKELIKVATEDKHKLRQMIIVTGTFVAVAVLTALDIASGL